ncbi:glycosyltransferase family 39 protein [Variovorax paradoxus]|uniref:ArnT family glycosyltransferase n=1 Tax=Variovorax paradoxus TaxID=34073 RepID=UPI0021ABDC89|nr:glycosyltransferase family 39 protein [Variovorax paradoxus]UVH60577.1 glycosyltransferase family 39 protein [Variovorax paradoxus]
MPRLFTDTRQALGTATTCILVFLVALRLVSLAGYPLMDTTEGRYGEIARKMAERGDWITPWFTDGTPFWGKPPLAFWLSAGSMQIFGANEFAARLPHFLMAVAIAVLTFDWARRAGMRRPAYVLPLLATTVLFWTVSGAVTTDMALCLGTVLSMRSFWLALQGPAEHREREAWLFIAGLWIALLAKGPVGCALILLPAGAWALWTGQARRVWQAVPWMRNGVLLLALAAPWYVLAEIRTPGFLDYFFVGEHWNRFFVSGWQGDRYGTAHAFPRGTIWLFLAGAFLPWSIVVPLAAWRTRRKITSSPTDGADTDARRSFVLYLLACGLAPCVIFTAAGNILWTYVLPSLPPLAVLAALWLNDRDDGVARRLLLAGTLVAIVLFAGWLLDLTTGGRAEAKSAKAVVQLYRTQLRAETPLAFVQERMFSAAFYSGGRALHIADPLQIADKRPQEPLFVAVPHSVLGQLPQALLPCLQVAGDAGSYRLFLRAPCTEPRLAMKSHGDASQEGRGGEWRN